MSSMFILLDFSLFLRIRGALFRGTEGAAQLLSAFASVSTHFVCVQITAFRRVLRRLGLAGCFQTIRVCAQRQPQW